MIGQTISHYKILEKLGEGGMGVVYKAEDTKLKRTVALKFLPPGLTRDSQAKERFLHEAQAAAALEHQHICNIYEIDETEDQIFIVMSCFEGQTLKEKIDAGPLKIDEALKIAIQAAEGLQAAHEKGIVHRDIKSANIMVTEKEQTKIMDFGLAKLKGQTKITKEGSTLGTAAYMSPEQSQGADVDHRTDIWSLGVVLYEMITGQLPFRGEYEQAVIYSIMNEQPEPLTALRTGVPMELERIINKSLSKDPSERYQHADDLMVDLRKLKKDTKPETAPSMIKTSPGITIKASLKLLVLTGIILAAIVIVVGMILFKGEPEPGIPIIGTGDRPSLAIVYFENKSGDKSLDNWREAFSELLTTDLSQSRYLRVLRSDQVYGIFKKLNLLETKRYSTEDLKKVAKKGRVNRILKGSYIKAGDNFVITAMLINADNGETISSLSVEAKGEKNIFPMVDDLTKKIKLELDLTPEQVFADIDSNVGTVTTSSPEAYRHFLHGLKYHNNLQYRQAIRALEKAIKIDPNFALAYRKLSVAYSNLGYDVRRAKFLKKAFQLRQRVSERERLLIQIDFYRESEKTFDKAIQSYDRLLRLYPGDMLGSTIIALLYKEIEEWDKAIEQLKITINNDEPFTVIYWNMSELYLNKGMHYKAREVLEKSLDKVFNQAASHRNLTWLYINLGQYDRALMEVGKAFSLDPYHYDNIRCLGDIYFCRGELEKTAAEYKKLPETKEIAAVAYYKIRMAALDSMQGKVISQKAFIEDCLKNVKEWNIRWAERGLRFRLGAIYRKTGNPGAALKEYDKMLQSAVEDEKLEHQRLALWNIGLTYLEMGSIEKARETADRLKSLIENGVNPKKIRYYYHLQGQISRETRDFSNAIANFKKALAGVPQHWDFRMPVLYSMGNTYLQAGDMEKAQKPFEKIVSFNGFGRIYNSNLIPRSCYTLGKIYHKTGLKSKAINSYKKFIDLWKDCDPQFQPMVEDARKRLKELEE
ncbi:MAG: protein kinase [Candidatus Aminicenantes bacterium]